jgi:hypothetical protein
MAFHHTWPFNQDYWLLFLKVSFDGVTKLITVNSNESVIDVQEDLYSAWKRWMQTRDNMKYINAMRTVGGDPTVGGEFLGATFFVTNGWRIVLTNATTIEGNIFSDDFDTPYLTEEGVVIAFSKVSNLIDKVAPTTETLTEVASSVVNTLNTGTYDGVAFEDIMPILLAMAQGKIVNSSSGVYDIYAQDNTSVLYTLTESGVERNRS